MRHEILRMLENNSRIDLHDLAIMLGADESAVSYTHLRAHETD